MKSKFFFPFILIITVLQSSLGAFNETVINRLFDAERKAMHLVGLAAVVVKNEEVVWANGFGLRDYSKKDPVTTDTIFLVASLSKTVTGVALMTLFDQGKFKLDDDINNYLPFSVRNPAFPDVPITFRMLLTHTSSIIDERYDEIKGLTVFGSDQSPDPTTAFVKLITDYLSPTGAYFRLEGIYSTSQPGTKFSYSNIGTALIGFLVQNISGKNFNEYCKEEIFTKLGMNSTGWFLSEVDLNRLAIPYTRGFGNIPPKPYGHYTFPDYPNGQLMTTILDLSKFLMMFMNFGTLNDVKILERSTAELMREVTVPTSPTFGLHWYYENIGNRRMLGHNGSEKGVNTDMYFNPVTSSSSRNVGAIIFCNTDDEKKSGSRQDDIKKLNLDKLMSELIEEALKP